MPIVRPYPIGEVLPQPLPNAQPNVAAAGDIASFGGNQARDLQQAGANLDRASDNLFGIYERAAKEANESRIQDFNNQFIWGSQDILRTGSDAYFKLRGADAIQGAAGATERLKNLKDQVLGQTANPYQRQRLGPILDAHFASATDQIAQHVDQQQQVYDRGVHTASIEVAQREATTNPENLGGAITRAADATRSFFKGQAPEVVENEVLKAVSRVVSGPIRDRLARNDPSAVGLYRQYQDRLDPRDRIALGAAVETLSNGIAAADWVRSRSAGPISAQAVAVIKTSMAHWQADGYSAPVAAGITAGFLRESQFHGGAVNKGDGRDGSDSISIGQWNGPRGEAFKAFAADYARKTGLDPRDQKVGLAYAKAEIDGVIPYSVSGLSPDFKTRLQAARTEKEAADIMTRGYFRPKYTEGESAIRQGSASAILAQYGGQSPTGDTALDAVNAANPAVPPPVISWGGRLFDQEGVADYRQRMTGIEERRLALTALNDREFAGNPARQRANQIAIDAHTAQDRAAVKAEADKAYADLQAHMTKGGPGGGPAVTLPPPTIMSQFTDEQQASIARQVNRNVEGRQPTTDLGLWYGLFSALTGDNADMRAEASRLNLTQFAEHLSAPHFQSLETLQKRVRDGEATQVLTHAEKVNLTLQGLGIEPSPRADSSPNSDAAKAARFHRAFQDELTIFEHGKGRKATPQEAWSIIDGLVRAAVEKGIHKPVFQIEFADIPVQDQAEIADAIRSAHGIPTEERVAEAYRHKLAMEPRQTEIPPPSPAFNVRLGREAIGVGATGQGSVVPGPPGSSRLPPPGAPLPLDQRLPVPGIGPKPPASF